MNEWWKLTFLYVQAHDPESKPPEELLSAYTDALQKIKQQAGEGKNMQAG